MARALVDLETTVWWLAGVFVCVLGAAVLVLFITWLGERSR